MHSQRRFFAGLLDNSLPEWRLSLLDENRELHMTIQWYCNQQGQQFGPFSWDKLKQFAASGQLSPSDLIWKDGMPAWVTASSVEGLFLPIPNQRRRQGSARSRGPTPVSSRGAEGTRPL